VCAHSTARQLLVCRLTFLCRHLAALFHWNSDRNLAAVLRGYCAALGAARGTTGTAGNLSTFLYLLSNRPLPTLPVRLVHTVPPDSIVILTHRLCLGLTVLHKLGGNNYSAELLILCGAVLGGIPVIGMCAGLTGSVLALRLVGGLIYCLTLLLIYLVTLISWNYGDLVLALRLILSSTLLSLSGLVLRLIPALLHLHCAALLLVLGYRVILT